MQANALVEMALYHLRMGSRNYKQAERDFKRAKEIIDKKKGFETSGLDQLWIGCGSQRNGQ